MQQPGPGRGAAGSISSRAIRRHNPDRDQDPLRLESGVRSGNEIDGTTTCRPQPWSAAALVAIARARADSARMWALSASLEDLFSCAPIWTRMAITFLSRSQHASEVRL